MNKEKQLSKLFLRIMSKNNYDKFSSNMLETIGLMNSYMNVEKSKETAFVLNEEDQVHNISN